MYLRKVNYNLNRCESWYMKILVRVEKLRFALDKRR